MWRVPTTEPEPRRSEAATSQDSFHSLNELSESPEPTEPRTKPVETEINTMAPEGNTADVNMKDGTTKPTELKLSPPKIFNGKRDEFDKFLQNILLYLDINDELYNTDKKKIAYALSFMDEGDADSWRAQFLLAARKTSGLELGTWSDFEKNLIEAFKPYDAPGDALEKITMLKMGNNSIEDHISRYKILLSKAGINTDSPSAIDYFRKSLNIPLQKNLLNLATPPKNLDEWYEWATRLDNNFRKMQRVFGRDLKKKEEPKKHWQFQKRERDPNAMDIDALALEKRNEMMKKGLCFGCGKPGHLNRDCPDKKKPTSYSPPSYSPPSKKMGAKELYTHIRSLTTLLTEEEKDEFFKEAEEQGF